jgi:hypothetical protein
MTQPEVNMNDDFCLIHGRDYMRTNQGTTAYCERCTDPDFIEAEKIAYAIREYTYRPFHDAGWDFDIAHDDATKIIADALKIARQSIGTKE